MGIRAEANCLSKLEFRQVRYVVEGHTVLDELDLDVNAGETLVLLGRSGSGKTTALRLINRMIEPTSGTIRIDGEEIAPMNRGGTAPPDRLRDPGFWTVAALDH